MLPQWAANYIGLPWRAGGRTRDGVDCWGLYRLAATEALGLPLPDHDGLAWDAGVRAQGIARAAEAFASRFVRVAPGCEQAGDAATFRIGGLPIHVGMVLAPGIMLHIEEGQTSCLARYTAAAWERRLHSFHRCTVSGCP